MYAHISLGLDATGATHLLIMFFLGYFVAAQLGGRIFDARGAKPTILLGCAVAAAGFVWWATQITTLDASAQRLPLVVAGAGIGLLLGPSSSDAVSRAERRVVRRGHRHQPVGAELRLRPRLRRAGHVLTHVFTSRFTQSLVDLGTPRATAEQAASHASSGAGASSGALSTLPASARAAVEHAAAHDFAVGMQAVLIGMAAALALAFCVALLHPGDRPAQDGDPVADTATSSANPPRPEPPTPARTRRTIMNTRLASMLAVASAALAVTAAMAAPAASAAPAPHPQAPVVKRIPVRTNPYQVAVSRRLQEAFVVNRGSVSVVGSAPAAPPPRFPPGTVPNR